MNTNWRGKATHTDHLRLHYTMWLWSFRNFQIIVSGNTPLLLYIPVCAKSSYIITQDWRFLPSPSCSHLRQGRFTVFHGRFGINSWDREFQRQRGTTLPSTTGTGPSVPFLQAGTKILFLRKPSTPLEAQAPGISEMQNFRHHSSACSQAAPNVLWPLHLSELSPQQLTHPPSERRDSRTGSSGTGSHHMYTVLSTSCIFLNWKTWLQKNALMTNTEVLHSTRVPSGG